MKSPLKIIERMVKDYPNDMELGSKIRHYIYWLKGNKDDKKNDAAKINEALSNSLSNCA